MHIPFTKDKFESKYRERSVAIILSKDTGRLSSPKSSDLEIVCGWSEVVSYRLGWSSVILFFLKGSCSGPGGWFH